MTDKNPLLTLTGVDVQTPIKELVALATSGVEVGFLLSMSATGMGRPRYPALAWIVETARLFERAALHVCGGVARRALLAGELPVRNFKRIQVNGGLSLTELRQLCDLYPKQGIILQLNTANAALFNTLNADPELCAGAYSWLVDASGGRGLTPEEWMAPDTPAEVGFAGGLGPDNIEAMLPELSKIAKSGWWVDMETKLRTDDWFNIQKARTVIDAWRAFATTPPFASGAEVESVVCLSTQHLAPVELSSANWNDAMHRALLAEYAHGFMFKTHGEGDGLPEHLRTILQAAKRAGFAYVKFDADGPISGAFEVFDHV